MSRAIAESVTPWYGGTLTDINTLESLIVESKAQHSTLIAQNMVLV